MQQTSRAVIPVPSDPLANPSGEVPFEIRDTLSIYEAAMVYAGRHPMNNFLGGKAKDFVFDEAGKKVLNDDGTARTSIVDYGRGSLRDYETLLGRGKNSGPRKLAWDIYCELRKRVERGAIKPTRAAYLPTGEMDPRDTIIETAELIKLAQERRERPIYFEHLMQSPKIHTGLPNRAEERQRTRGRKTVLDWEVVKNEVFRLMDDNGEFMPGDPAWSHQAQLETAIKNFIAKRFELYPAESTIRKRVGLALKEWREAKAQAEN